MKVRKRRWVPLANGRRYGGNVQRILESTVQPVRKWEQSHQSITDCTTFAEPRHEAAWHEIPQRSISERNCDERNAIAMSPGLANATGSPDNRVVRLAVGSNCVMTTEQFRATLHQQPFRPFTIRMVDGRSFEVVHPDFIALSPTGRTVIVFEREDNYSILDLLLMSELRVGNRNPP